MSRPLGTPDLPSGSPIRRDRLHNDIEEERDARARALSPPIKSLPSESNMLESFRQGAMDLSHRLFGSNRGSEAASPAGSRALPGRPGNSTQDAKHSIGDEINTALLELANRIEKLAERNRELDSAK